MRGVQEARETLLEKAEKERLEQLKQQKEQIKQEKAKLSEFKTKFADLVFEENQKQKVKYKEEFESKLTLQRQRKEYASQLKKPKVDE